MSLQDLHPSHIGPYEVVKVLGEGGVGVVYLVNQVEPIRRQVALKVIRLDIHSLEIIKRFELERQALAMMNHSNIAKVFDVGKTETGRPYIAMEYVAGIPITDYCDTHRLDIAARLKLFATVCNAVQYAHQKGMLHRDIKPTNIIVRFEDGQHVPMLIDFGLAKAVGGEQAEEPALTQQGQPLGTPQYMSPEQIELPPHEIDTRTDVYSLGVVLYELLIGVLPHERKFSPYRPLEFIEDLRKEGSTTRPSTRLKLLAAEMAKIVQARSTNLFGLAKKLRGDLDWIAMMALERDRERRYSTASELANDVERWLENRPIVAHPPSTGYRLECFVKRNRVAVAVAMALLVATIFGSAASTFWYMRAGDSWKEKNVGIRLFDDVRSEVANLHLWFEEAIANDKTLDLERDVRAPLSETLRRVEEALAAETKPTGSAALAADRNPGRIRELRDQLLIFDRITLERWEKKNAEGAIGGSLDQRYDAVYNRIRSVAREISEELQADAAKDWQRSGLMSIAVNIFALSLIALALVIAGRIWSRKT